MEPHPIRLVVTDDLRRNRLTVFFRLLLAIPHFIWLFVWGIGNAVVLILSWFAALFTGRVPTSFHDFMARYLTYQTQVLAYLQLAANPKERLRVQQAQLARARRARQLGLEQMHDVRPRPGERELAGLLGEIVERINHS